MTGSVDRRGKSWNRSVEGETAKGSNGKLNSDQIRERAKLHAMRYATGQPTIEAISIHWMTTYGIQMSYSSEKEWAWRNEGLIESTMNELINLGELKQPAMAHTTFMATASEAGKGSGKLVAQLEKKIKAAIEKLDPFCDPRVILGYTEEKLSKMSVDDRQKADARIEYEDKRNKLRLTMITVLCESLGVNKKLLLAATKMAKDMFDESILSERKIGAMVKKKMEEVSDETKNASDVDFIDVEVKEEDRERLLDT